MCVEDAWKKRARYANRAAPPCQPGVRLIGVFACRSPRVDVRSVLSQVRDAFMVTDSFHLSRPFTLKSRLPVKKARWTASLHRHSQLLLTQAPRNLLRSVHTLLNQPAAEEGPLRAWAARLPARPQGPKTTKGLFSQHTRFSQKCSPLQWRQQTGRVCFRNESSENHPVVLNQPYFYSIPYLFLADLWLKL